MKFYGEGVLRYPGTSRTVHDFEDGPFETLNADIIRHALNMGYSTEPQPEPVALEPEPIPEKVTEQPIRSRGRPKKVVENADEISGTTEETMGDGSEACGEVRIGNAEGQEVTEEKEGE